MNTAHAHARFKAQQQRPPLRFCLPVLVLCLFMSLAGCAGKSSPGPNETAPNQTAAGQNADPAARKTAKADAPQGPLLRYSADFAYASPSPSTSGSAASSPAASSPAASSPAPNAPTSAARDAAPPPELLRALTASSLLLKLKDSPPDDLQGLEFRIDKDEAEARRLMQAFGYYDGTVQRVVLAPGAPSPAEPQNSGPADETDKIDNINKADNSDPSHSTGSNGNTGSTGKTDNAALWRVRLTLTPGPRYTVGETVVRYAEDPALSATQTTATPTAATQTAATSPQPAPSTTSSATPGAPTSATPGAPTSAPPSPPLGATPPASALPSQPTEISALPASLEDAGLTPGSPAEASRILRAVERLPEILGQRGYPLAEVKGTRYAVDKETRQLFATVLVQAGPKARMGRVVMRGESQVQPAYLEKLRPWEQGAAWDQRLVEDYRDLLVRQGLFRSIELHPEPAASAPPALPAASPTATTALPGAAEPLPSSALPGAASTLASSTLPSSATSPADASASRTTPSATPVYDLVATLADAPQRTVGGGLNYESNRGPGVQAYWEHRNLLGQGERFRAEASVWEDSQFARATFRKPAFFDRSQELTAEAWLRNEDTDAYSQRAAWLSAGLERRLWGPLFASAGVAVEGGDLEDPTHPRRGYTMAGLPLQVRYEGASGPGGSQLDPERGLRATLGVRPSWGEYAGSFFITPTRLTLSGYVPMGSVGVDADTGRVIPRMVLAARGAAGTLWRGDSQRIPAAARYYGGGGGSVRGYAYQSLGPRDVHGDPLGGASFAELSLEARVRITENIAIVPFLDGGNVYSGVTPGFERDGTTTGLQWGAGLGLRYHTAVGPLRLDVATPLNPRKDDGKFFLYISIGQSF